MAGVTPETFEAMLEIVKAAYKETHSKYNGRQRKLSCEDIVNDVKLLQVCTEIFNGNAHDGTILRKH